MLKIKEWLIGLGVLLAGLAAVFFTGRSKGVKAQQSTDVKQAAKAAEIRENVSEKVESLPEPAPVAQVVADADPNSAVGELRDDGWSN